MQLIEIFFPEAEKTDEEIASRTTNINNADEFKENRHGRNKGHKGGKKVTERNLGTRKKATTGYNWWVGAEY